MTRSRASAYVLLCLASLFWAGNWVIGRALRAQAGVLYVGVGHRGDACHAGARRLGRATRAAISERHPDAHEVDEAIAAGMQRGKCCLSIPIFSKVDG